MALQRLVPSSIYSSGRLLRICGHLSVNTTSRNSSFQAKEMEIYDGKMSYIDTEIHNEHAVIFLHGNPTSSFLWRNIIPHVSNIARCLAPDLIGMGKSSKIPGMMYTFQDHFEYLSKWMESVNLPRKINLVVHDWGSGLGFHWACLHPDRIASITHMESLIGPLTSWDEFPAIAADVFKAFRTPNGEEMVIHKNLFVELLLPRSIIRKLTADEMATYIAPFKKAGESRRPTLTWPREIPVASDGPEDVVKFATAWNKWLSTTNDIPKLYINGDPGFFSSVILEKTKDWSNHRVVTVKGLHFLQEDSPDEIGEAIRNFLTNEVFK